MPVRLRWLLIPIAFLVFLGILAWYTKTTQWDLDIRSGNVRVRTLTLGVLVHEERQSTWVWQAVQPRADMVPEWRVVRRREFGIRATHQWLSAYLGVERMERTLADFPVSPETERRMAEAVLAMWSDPHSRDAASESHEFLANMTERIWEASRAQPAGQPLTPADLGL